MAIKTAAQERAISQRIQTSKLAARKKEIARRSKAGRLTQKQRRTISRDPSFSEEEKLSVERESSVQIDEPGELAPTVAGRRERPRVQRVSRTTTPRAAPSPGRVLEAGEVDAFVEARVDTGGFRETGDTEQLIRRPRKEPASGTFFRTKEGGIILSSDVIPQAPRKEPQTAQQFFKGRVKTLEEKLAARPFEEKLFQGAVAPKEKVVTSQFDLFRRVQGITLPFLLTPEEQLEVPKAVVRGAIGAGVSLFEFPAEIIKQPSKLLDVPGQILSIPGEFAKRPLSVGGELIGSAILFETGGRLSRSVRKTPKIAAGRSVSGGITDFVKQFEVKLPPRTPTTPGFKAGRASPGLKLKRKPKKDIKKLRDISRFQDKKLIQVQTKRGLEPRIVERPLRDFEKSLKRQQRRAAKPEKRIRLVPQEVFDAFQAQRASDRSFFQKGFKIRTGRDLSVRQRVRGRDLDIPTQADINAIARGRPDFIPRGRKARKALKKIRQERVRRMDERPVFEAAPKGDRFDFLRKKNEFDFALEDATFLRLPPGEAPSMQRDVLPTFQAAPRVVTIEQQKQEEKQFAELAQITLLDAKQKEDAKKSASLLSLDKPSQIDADLISQVLGGRQAQRTVSAQRSAERTVSMQDFLPRTLSAIETPQLTTPREVRAIGGGGGLFSALRTGRQPRTQRALPRETFADEFSRLPKSLLLPRFDFVDQREKKKRRSRFLETGILIHPVKDPLSAIFGSGFAEQFKQPGAAKKKGKKNGGFFL